MTGRLLYLGRLGRAEFFRSDRRRGGVGREVREDCARGGGDVKEGRNFVITWLEADQGRNEDSKTQHWANGGSEGGKSGFYRRLR